MVEKAPVYEYHVTFEAVPPVGLLSTMGPFLNTDVTNPRELYSILSESRHHGTLLTSVTVNPQPTAAKLPPLQSSSETAQFRSLGEQAQHSSYPDLVSFHRQHGGGGTSSRLASTPRRSTSLQDVSSLHNIDSMLVSKKLTPITRGTDAAAAKNAASDQQEKGIVAGEVRFAGKKEGLSVHLNKDRPLPPIEGKGGQTVAKGDATVVQEGAGTKGGEDLALVGLSPQPQRRPSECPREIFPRGQPVEVKKPVTPTYDDYPEAYWELRSPTLQDPRDLKEDMIDRDHYRLQQISSLRLRAMNRDVAASRLDSHRKWQETHEHLPPLGQPIKTDSSRAVTFNIPATSERHGKQQVALLPVRNHSLAVVPKTASSPNIPAIKKQNESNTNVDLEKTDQSQEGVNGEEQAPPQDTDARIPTEKKAAAQKQEEVKKVRASVVNLFMSTDRQPNMAISDINTGVRNNHTTTVTRPQSDKAMIPHVQQGQGQNHGPQIPGHPRRLSASSNDGTASSSLSHYIMQRHPSAPCDSPPPQPQAVMTNRDCDEATNGNAETTKRKNAGSKLILKKFNKLQVFGETSAGTGSHHHPSMQQNWDITDMGQTARKKPYLPKNRPPTYRLDMRSYPARRLGSAERGDDRGINMEGGGYPILVSERGGMPIVSSSSAADKVDAASLSFRFRDGEVIVSRQGKKPNLT